MRNTISLRDVARHIAGDVPGGTAPMSVTSDRAASSAGALQGRESPPSHSSAECGQRSPRNLAALLLATVAFAIGCMPAFAEQFHFTRSRVDGLPTNLSGTLYGFAMDETPAAAGGHGYSARKSNPHIPNDISEAYQSVEQQGVKIGRMFTEQNRNREDQALAHRAPSPLAQT